MQLIECRFQRESWQYFWLKRVQGVNLDQHCGKSLVGKYLKLEPQELSGHAHYLCGVAPGWNYDGNLHIAFAPAPGELLEVEEKGVRLVVQGARRLDIPPLAAGQFAHPMGNRRPYYTCRNWQFAVAYAQLIGELAR